MIARSAPTRRLTKPLKSSRCAYHSGPPSGCFAVILCYVPAIGSRHVLALAVMVSLLAVPVAAAVGTAVHDSRRDVYAQQHHTRHLVTATITDDTAAQNISRTNTATEAARWSATGAEHTGTVTAQSATKPGDHVAIWVDNNGALTYEPTPTTRAGVDAVTAALFMWAGVTAAAAILLAATRAVGDRIRAMRWQHAIDTLVGRDGHKPSQP